MSTSIEIEAKALLSKDDYFKVLSKLSLDVSDGFIQKNYYIDTKKSELRALGVSLRIRKLNGYVMTLKLPMAEGLLEKSQTLTKEQFEELQSENIFPSGDISDFLESLYIDPTDLVIVASLSTLRIQVKFGESTLAIDENRYGSFQDYELEMESSTIKRAKDQLEKLCNDLEIHYVENHDSKQKRAINALIFSD